jgi:hypothetical protein
MFKKHHPHDDYDHQHLKVEKDMMKVAFFLTTPSVPNIGRF